MLKWLFQTSLGWAVPSLGFGLAVSIIIVHWENVTHIVDKSIVLICGILMFGTPILLVQFLVFLGIGLFQDLEDTHWRS